MSVENQLTSYDCMDVKQNEGGFNFYGFTKADGSWKILREKTDGSEYRFAVGKSAYSTNFSNRASLVYKQSDSLPRV
jgi:hypothetical protein